MKKYKVYTPTLSLVSGRRVRLITQAGELTIQWRANRRHETEAPSHVAVPEEKWMTESQISEHANIPEYELRQMRFSASGPPYLRDGRAVLYRMSMLRNWKSMQP